jgi:hypothetical protein
MGYQNLPRRGIPPLGGPKIDAVPTAGAAGPDATGYALSGKPAAPPSRPVIKRGARPWGRERVARALTREESRERIQPDAPRPGAGEHPDNPRGGIPAFCRFFGVKDLLTPYLPDGGACKIDPGMTFRGAVIAGPRDAQPVS